ncbi:MAG: 4-hydroxy-3-methylbut-2-enyl diphosphate reductase [Bacteroidetes bacterium]|nr:MAG: 4-hydroxy-3-methylbut-2-enyl diphosphate reductase [Bacteroidota bacterium]
MKSFTIPEFYRSPVISKLKQLRREKDPRKKDMRPSALDFGPVQIFIARHFGFCYGVENAIEISFKAVEENPGKRIFLLSQMIHNPAVNNDLTSRGVQFLMDTAGNMLVPFENLTPDDIVIIPAFGTTIAIEEKLRSLGIDPLKYNTTCPFVERVWNRAGKLGDDQHTIIIHGKPEHEETRATFSRSAAQAPALVVNDMDEAKSVGDFILGKITEAVFLEKFGKRISAGFSPEKDFTRVGVINQTTMLASDTQAIADYFRQVMLEKYGEAELKNHFADTRDTLCYATNENQDATYGLLETGADLALVVGGYNSSNTSHLVELCEQKFPTYFIKDETELLSAETIRHFDLHTHAAKETANWLPGKRPLKIAAGLPARTVLWMPCCSVCWGILMMCGSRRMRWNCWRGSCKSGIY